MKRLEFLTDESMACVDLLEDLSKFANLDEVVVHGIGYFNSCAAYHMDKEIAQKIIDKVLANTNIKTLRLKSFQTINRCVVFEVKLEKCILNLKFLKREKCILNSELLYP